MIRQAGLNTSIGRSIELKGVTNVYSYPDSFCASACAYAFLGGVVRSFEGDHSYGIHRFGVKAGTISGDDAQVVSSIVAKYIESMGIDLAVFEMASNTPFEGDIYWVPPDIAKRMRIIYDPTGVTRFVVEQQNAMITASFHLKTYTREYDGVVACSSGQRVLVLIDSNNAIPDALRSAKEYPVEFKTPDGMLFGTATYLVTAQGGEMVFSLPNLDETAFRGSGLLLWNIDNPNLQGPNYAERLQWIDSVSTFSFEMRAPNAEQTLPIVLRGCGHHG